MPYEDQIHPIRILALGDSYTIGTGVVGDERWPNQLAAALRKHGLQVYVPGFLAHNGWTTGDLLAAISSFPYEGNFDLVTLLIGVNNQFQGLDIEEFHQDFELLLKKAIEYTGGDPNRVIVLSIPDWGDTPFAAGFDRLRISREIDEFNWINRRLSNEAGVYHIDITPLSRQVGQQPANLVEDELHPSAEMYAAWVELVLPVALLILQ
ncbi:MAG: hypothetical protein A2Z16_05165 [Chloroflexi bacterium RBG_16_54_18]|nr:MAG: hypothetical protein A2Z16_05165 [Chloroflexi bacterium RBG_16_54_18]